MGRLADIIAHDFGGPVDAVYNRLIANVGVAVLKVFPLDADRLGATIINLSVNKVYAGPFSNVSATKGILLGPNGGQLVLTYGDDFLTTGAEWFVKADKANSAIFTLELIAQAKTGAAPA